MISPPRIMLSTLTTSRPAIGGFPQRRPSVPSPLLFTPGPVMLDADTRDEGSRQMVYHRTPEFSRRVLRCEQLLKESCRARDGDRMILLTGSGTAAMEATVLNLFAPGDRVLVVEGGDFGHRFVEIAELHGLAVTPVRLAPGQPLTALDLAAHAGRGFAGLLVNHHETSTGTLFDLDLVARFCRAEGCLLVVDAIGSFLADEVAMADWGIDALIVSSQKALALPPGLSFVALSERAQQRVSQVTRRSYYFDFRKHLADIRRGQTPFTPAVGLVGQLERRLEKILAQGVSHQIETVRAHAMDFRIRIHDLPFALLAESPSNAVTALVPLDGATPDYYVRGLAEKYGIYVCPNGGALSQRIFRVGHLGDVSFADQTRLIAALRALADARHPQLLTVQ